MEIDEIEQGSFFVFLSMKFFAVIALFACSNAVMAQGVNKPVQSNNDTLGLTFMHKVKKGETLYKIAKMYKMTVPQLNALNPDVKTLSPGMSIHVVRKSVKATPSANAVTVPTQNLDVHVVEKGETLYSIAKKYNTSVEVLRKINNFGDANISLGQSIQVPVVNPIKGTKKPVESHVPKEKIVAPVEENVPQKAPNIPVEKPKGPESPVMEKKAPKESTVKIEFNQGRDQGGMPEKLVKPSAEIGLKENEQKGVLTLASNQFAAAGEEDRAWVYFDGAAQDEVVAVINTKNNKFVWCVVKGKNAKSNSVISVSKFVADKLGIFDEKTVVRVKYAVAK